MRGKFVSQIQNSGKVVFGITENNELFFDGKPIAKVPKHVNKDKLMLALKDDVKLNELIDQYYKLSQELEGLEQREKELTRKIDLGVLDSIILETEFYGSNKECKSISKDFARGQVIYRGKYFSIVTTETNVDLSCYTEQMDKKFGEISPDLFIELSHDERSIAVFVNGHIVYITPAFKLNAMLGYLQSLKFLGELETFVNYLRELNEIEEKGIKQVEVYESIRKHVLSIIKSLHD